METRKNNRLSEYDYGSIGAYFITICVKDKQKILSHIIRNRHDYDAAWKYIDENPIKWSSDEFYN